MHAARRAAGGEGASGFYLIVSKTVEPTLWCQKLRLPGGRFKKPDWSESNGENHGTGGRLSPDSTKNPQQRALEASCSGLRRGSTDTPNVLPWLTNQERIHLSFSISRARRP
ncbi:hypothetical protein EYF80_032879 [Liparis tanakae]|uniref:Uncharacterized protein n=1 Tax=Liparis tanakae TaxID=230148 RepID=A0A4Z2GTY6_9TELE|nr:hypothetical protein EYF80_032879 [Liparis tanakae]